MILKIFNGVNSSQSSPYTLKSLFSTRSFFYYATFKKFSGVHTINLQLPPVSGRLIIIEEETA